MYSGVPGARPWTPEGDFAELERMMNSSNYPTNRAVPLTSDHAQQIPILSAQSVNTSIPISHNPHEGPRNISHSGGDNKPPGTPHKHENNFHVCETYPEVYYPPQND